MLTTPINNQKCTSHLLSSFGTTLMSITWIYSLKQILIEIYLRRILGKKYFQNIRNYLRSAYVIHVLQLFTTFVFNSREFAIDTFSKAKYFPGCLWKFFKARVWLIVMMQLYFWILLEIFHKIFSWNYCCIISPI